MRLRRAGERSVKRSRTGSAEPKAEKMLAVPLLTSILYIDKTLINKHFYVDNY
jgi:hypothetical protein